MYLWQRKKLVLILSLTNLVVVFVGLLLQLQGGSEQNRTSELSAANAEAANQLIEDSKQVLSEFDEGAGNPEELRQLRQQIDEYEERNDEREIASKRSESFSKAVFICLLINISLMFATIAQQRKPYRPLEFSASKTAYEPLTYHSIEE